MRALILGCAGTELSAVERSFFVDTDPFGFILFKRNCENSDQIRLLVGDLRDCVGRRAPVLIDQEGGRVQRLQPPQWRRAPAAELFGRMFQRDRVAAEQACRVNARLIAADLADLGIDVDCLPLLDVRQPDGHAVIGDRAFSEDPGTVAALGRAQAEGLAAGGVGPIAKHIPGHGRAGVDSHHALPVVETPLDTLRAVDFAPFAALADLPMAMTAHVVYSAIDPDRPATLSRKLIAEVIRGDIGFDGLLMTDDVSMKALSGSVAESAEAALSAGCDLVLHCNGDIDEMRALANTVPDLSGAALARAERALRFLERIRREARPADRVALERAFGDLLARAEAGA